MADEATQAPEETQDTPPVETPAEQDTSQVVDYAKRYNDLRPEFDRTKQAYAEAQAILQDPEKLAEYWQTQGYGADEDDDTFDTEAVDPTYQELQELRQETAALKEWRSQQEQASQQQAQISYIDEQLAAIENEHGEISDNAAAWIGSRAYANRDEQGNPDVAKAFEEFRSILEEDRAKYVKSKKAPQVKSGGSASEPIDLSDSSKRIDYIDQKMAELEE